MLARAAKNGQGIPLKPKDCEDWDIPFQFQIAVDQAHRVMSWMENLPSKEIPPEWMWPFENRLKEWFEAVQNTRGNGGGSSSDSSGDGMIQNEYAIGRGKDS